MGCVTWNPHLTFKNRLRHIWTSGRQSSVFLALELSLKAQSCVHVRPSSRTEVEGPNPILQASGARDRSGKWEELAEEGLERIRKGQGKC